MNHYQPQPYPGRLTLLRVRAQPLFSAHLNDMGWSRYAQGGVEVRLIPGFHEKVLVEPNAPVLAERLHQALAQARAEHSILPSAYTTFTVKADSVVASE